MSAEDASVAGKRKIDWESIELHYRAGVRSLMDIAKEYGVSDAGILKKAKTNGWSRDLAAKIRAKADAKVSAAAVSAELVKSGEKDIVDSNAELQYQIRMDHRSRLGRLAVVHEKLLAHIESVADALPNLHEVVESLRSPDEKGRDAAHDKMRKAMDRSAIFNDMKTLSEVDERIRRGQREAHGIDDKTVASNDSIEVMIMEACGA